VVRWRFEAVLGPAPSRRFAQRVEQAADRLSGRRLSSSAATTPPTSSAGGMGRWCCAGSPPAWVKLAASSAGATATCTRPRRASASTRLSHRAGRMPPPDHLGPPPRFHGARDILFLVRGGHSCRNQRPRRARRPRSTHRDRVRSRQHHPGRSRPARHGSSRRATGQTGQQVRGLAAVGPHNRLQVLRPPPAGLVGHLQDRVPCDVHHCCLTFAREGARLVGLAHVLDLKTSHGSSSCARVVGICEPLRPSQLREPSGLWLASRGCAVHDEVMDVSSVC
jgi:hypothetical protein